MQLLYDIRLEKMMKSNIGSADRLIRILAGVLLLVLFFVLDGGIRWIGLLGVVFLATAAMNFCPLYLPFGWSTRKAQTK
jgi:hypothetical protein